MIQFPILEQLIQSQEPIKPALRSNQTITNEKTQKQHQFKRRLWTCEENVLYARFLKLYTKKFSVNDGDKKFRKYKKMSLFMVSKTPKQCRTHHQKMMIKFGSVEVIIEELSSEKNQEKQVQKTEHREQQRKSPENISVVGPKSTHESQKRQQSIPSYSSEFIFDILF